MQVIDVVIPYKNSASKFYFYNIADWHLGPIYCHEEMCEGLVKQIATTQNAYAFIAGDVIDAVIPGDKRWDPSQKTIAKWVVQDDVVHSQVQRASKMLWPIREQIVCAGYGNHEETVRVAYSVNAHKHLIENLSFGNHVIQNSGFSCFLRLYFKRENSNETHLVTGFITHGSTSAVTKGGKLNALLKTMSKREADFYLYAHVHELLDEPTDYLCAKGKYGRGKIRSAEKTGALGGSFLQTYKQGPEASYGEKRTYDPTALGTVRFVIDPQYGEVGAETVRIRV